MQYKGFKQMKRAAAVILSAAIILTDVPGVSAAEYEQASETEIQEETVEERTVEESVSQDVPAVEETQDEQTQEPQTSAPDSSAIEEQSETKADDCAETEEAKTLTQEFETETTQETQATETETAKTDITQEPETETETNITETSETETETEITETQESEAETETQDQSVPVPDVDDSVYEFERIEYTYTNSAASAAAYHAEGKLEKNELGEYCIGNKDEFIAFLSSDTDYSDCTVRLNCDVDMKGETAQFTKKFQGTFIGDGHSIYNFKADGALFKEIGENGEVKGLHLSEINFSNGQVSAALALTNAGTISDISVRADLKITKDMTAAAGIVLENTGTVSGCVFAGTITADSDTDNSTKAVGGIVSSNQGTIENCHTLGSISTNVAKLGGIVANNAKTVRNCTNHMNIAGALGVGGIVAENTGTVTGCANYGTVTQKSNSDDGLAGGIAAANRGKISNCENYGEISGAYKNIGGIAGSSSDAITGCGNYAAVSGTENVGGIAGLCSGSGVDNCIRDSFNKGRIDAKTNSDGKSQGIGGILGAAAKATVLNIENCYNTAVINGAADTKYLGGIAGALYKGRIKGCYNTGNVSGAKSTEEFHSYAAAVAGFMGDEENAVCMECLILDSTGEVLYYRETGAVSASDGKRTSAELKSADALAVLGDGFTSDSVGINDGYPIVKDQNAKSMKCIIIYEPNGGCAPYYFSLVEKDGYISVPSTPSKKSAAFLGWFRDKEHKDEYGFSGSVAKSEVIYAGWESRKVVEDITLEQTEVTLIQGETFNLYEKVCFEPKDAENKELVFESDDPSTATVNEEGIVTAITEGTAKISIKMKDGSLSKKLTFTVKVTGEQNVIRFKLYNQESTAEFTRLSVSVNDPVFVQAVFGSEPPLGSEVIWSAAEPTGYVKVEGQTNLTGGSVARIEGLKPTSELSQNNVDVWCTVHYPDGKTYFTSVLKVSVKPLAENVSIQAGREDVTDKTVIYDIETRKFIAVGDTRLLEPTDTLSASILPKAANQKVKWSSSNSYVINFDDEDSGKAQGRVVGEATVTATAADGSVGKDKKPISGKTTVRVSRIIQKLSFTPKPMDGDGTIPLDKNGRIQIAEGASIRLVPTYTPNDATEKKIKWTIDNKNAIDKRVEDGTNVLIVTAKKVAQDTVVKLKAEAMDMGQASCELELVIKPKVEMIKIFRTDDVNQENNLSGRNIGIDPDKQEDLTFSLMAVNEPDNASQMVSWKINNTKIADFKDNEDGTCTVNVKGSGTAVITATATDGSKVTATTMLNVASLASNVEIEGSNMVMKGKTIKLTAAVYPKSAQSKNIRWTSSNPDCASVNPSTGEVRGVKSGFAIISATVNDGSGATGTHAVWVKDPVEDFDIMKPDGDDNIKNDKILTGKTIGLDPDDNKGTYVIAARILPDTASQEVEWKSSNEKIATVEPSPTDSKTCIITAKALGKTTITMSSVDGSGRKASITVNIGTLVKNIKVTGGHYVGVDQELQLKAEVGDKDATNKAVIWRSDNPKAATVEEDGLVTGIKDGDAVITAEAVDGSGVVAEHRVYVVKQKNDVTISALENCEIWTKNKKKYINDIDLSNRKNYELRLLAELSNGSAVRDGVPMDINWSTSNKDIATVEPLKDQSSIGVVTVRKAGTVKIYATTAEGYETSDSVTLTVTNKEPYVEITGAGHRLAGGKKMKLSVTNGVLVDWYTDTDQLVKVNNKGQVTAYKGAAGVATITATAVDGKSKNSDTYTIMVGDPVSQVDIRMNGLIVSGEKIGIDLMKGYNGNPVHLDALLDGVAGDDVKWKSSNNSIAELDEYGNVDFKKNGTVSFTATATDGSNKKAKVTFTVTKQITGMSPADNVSNIEVGLKKSIQLNIDYKPLASTMKKAIWESSDPSIVSVSKNSGKIKGKAEGVAVITATAADNSSVSCSFTVVVNPVVGKVEIVRAASGEGLPDGIYQDIIGIDLSKSDNTVLLKANLYQKIGKEYEAMREQRINWSSSNKNIAEVDENGKVLAKKSGEVTITATALDGSKKSGKVKVYIGKLITDMTPSDNIKDGIVLNLRTRKTMELAKEFEVKPITATNKTYTYTTSDKKIVTVNAKGKVTAKKAGDAFITITPKDGSGKSITIPVEVTR